MTNRSLPVANKELGQHFLVDQNIIKKITSDFKDRAEAIIEIGPGPAILSKSLSQLGLPYFVIEKDERFKEHLNQCLSDEQICFQDALKINFEQFLREKNLSGKKIWLVSNLPYNISVPLTIKFTQTASIEFMSLMYQREVSEKIINTRDKKNTAGSLMAIMSNYFEISFLTKVAPGAFSPPPKVDSAVISFVRKETPFIPLSEFSDYELFLRRLFQLKRKQVGKVLMQNYPKDDVINAFFQLNLKTTDRAESFQISQVSLLYQKLKDSLSSSLLETQEEQEQK